MLQVTYYMTSMYALILAAGYGTRMQKSAAGTEHEQLVKNLPKPLLPIKNKPVVFYIYQMLKKTSITSPPWTRGGLRGGLKEKIDKIYLVTNDKFYDQFTEWKNSKNVSIKIINDGSTENENRLGAIRDIELAIKTEKINDDLLIIAGDTLLDFDILDFIQFFQTKKAPIIALNIADSFKQIKQRNEVKINSKGKIVSFVEKPARPQTLLYSVPCYIFPKNILSKFSEYLAKNQKPDAPGMFIEWLHKKTPVYGYDKINRRFDIGNLDTYTDALKKF